MPGNYPEESIQHSEQGESLKSFSGAVYTLYQSVVKDTKTITKVILITCFNPLAYTDVPETAGLARSINP